MDTEKLNLFTLMTKEEALLQNPAMPAPEELLKDLELLDVTYFGFDNEVHKGQIVVNKKISKKILAFFEMSLAIHFPIEKVIPISHPNYAWDDNVSCDDNNSAGYNFRYIGGTSRMSKHAEGLAIDINPVQNPYIKFNENMEQIFIAPENGIFDPSIPGTLHKNHPLVIFLKNNGFDWGGDWTKESGRIDYQHFELSEK